jgi:hypothetical protein
MLRLRMKPSRCRSIANQARNEVILSQLVEPKICVDRILLPLSLVEERFRRPIICGKKDINTTYVN